MNTIRLRLFQHEVLLAVMILLLGAVITAFNADFLSPRHLFDLAGSTVVLGLLSLGVFTVMLSGGIDISFTAIAVFSCYATVKLFAAAGVALAWVPAFGAASLIGTALGCINGLCVGYFDLPALIVTLGTASVYHGLLLTAFGTAMIAGLPPSFTAPATLRLFEHVAPHGERTGLPAAFLIFLFLSLLLHLFLRHTLLGRGIYALGGNKEAAARSGFPLPAIRFTVYGLLGFLSALAGTYHAARMRNSNPFDIVGSELDVIAAVVLGGTSITGGRGTVAGTVLGVLLFVLITRSLILLGVPSEWQRVAVGLILLGSCASAALSEGRKAPWLP